MRYLVCGFALLLPAAAQEASIWIGRQVAVERVDVVRGGGYFPVLIRLDNGELGAAVRGGDTHIGAQGRLDWVRSTDGGRTWSRGLLADAPMDDRNPAVGQLRDGTVLVTYIIDRSYGPGGERLKQLTRDGLYTVRSHDRGRTWEAPAKSLIDPRHGASPFGKMVQLPGGTVLLNVYYERGPGLEHETSYLYRSRDGGLTWGDPTLIADDFNETALALLPDGRLLAVARSHHGGYLAATYSGDQGRTWSPPRRLTAEREHPADVILLRDGRLLLVYGERNRPFGARAMLSRDLGRTWGPELIVLAADAHNSDCGYPSSAEVAPGRIVTMYYGVDETTDAAGKTVRALSGAYARAVLWRAP
ncbi:MAG TPA: sialidase family protein [Bryobacteraceae bacterium]|nr:sialidase family protein [Bryobacteraceae bacterium]